MHHDTSTAARRSRTRGTLLVPPLLAPLLLAVGCTQYSYDRVQLGQTPGEYRDTLPAATSRQTALGFCHLNTDALGRTDAIVVLVTADRRVAAKLWAHYVERKPMMGDEPGFSLVGELDPELYGVAGAGPIDTLRAVAGEVSEYRGEKLALDAHTLVAAGLVRLMQRWPQVNDVGVSSQRLEELFDRVPGGGRSMLTFDEKGVFRFAYDQGAAR